MSNDKDKNILPLKSINGRRCLTKCYPKGEISVHPIILTGLTLETNNYCSIDPVYSKELQNNKISTGEKEFNMLFVDACRLEDNKIFQPPNELESILLSFYFNPNDFLSNIYNLHSFDEVIYWTLDNDYLPFDTIKRVHNCAWKAYGNKIEALTTTVIDYYYDMAKYRWLKDYVILIKNKYSFSSITNSKDLLSDEDEIYNIILNNYFDYNFFYTSVKHYVYEFQDEWDLIESHYKKLKKYVFNRLIDNIESDFTTNKVK